MKTRRGRYFPFDLLIFLSILPTVVISNLNGPEPHPEILVTVGLIVCYFSEVVLIRPRRIVDKAPLRKLVVFIYAASICLALYFLVPATDVVTPSWLASLENGSYTVAASSLLSITFWYIASCQQPKEYYLFEKGVKKINRGLQPQEETHINCN